MSRHQKKRWTAEDARLELARWSRSGLSMSEYCRRHGMGAHRLIWWRRRLDAYQHEEDTSSRLSLASDAFVEARVVGFAPGSEAAVTLRLGEVVVDVVAPQHTPPDWLASLMRALAWPG